MSSAPILAIDFDGVVCDSTDECVVTAWNAWQLRNGNTQFARTPGEVPDPFGTTLREYRSYVRTAGEYLILLEAARDSRRIASQAGYERLFEESRADLSGFGSLFFSARNQLRAESEDQWLGLHTVYQGIPAALQTLSGAFSLYVVTGKDAESVRLFFGRFGLPIPPSRIYDKDVAHDKLAAIRMIAANPGQPLSSAHFLDDNVYHLLPAKKAGCHTYLASWGYHTPEQLGLARQEGVQIVELQTWREVLLKSGVGT